MRKILFLYTALFVSLFFYSCNKENKENAQKEKVNEREQEKEHKHEPGKEHAHEPGKEHEHKDEHKHNALSYTLQSEHTKLFVEFPPLIVGEVSSFDANVTLTGDASKPLEVGKVKLTLENNGSATVDAPVTPGIFKTILNPVKAGKNLKLTIEITTKDFVDTLIIKDVIVYPNHKAVDKEHKH